MLLKVIPDSDWLADWFEEEDRRVSSIISDKRGTGRFSFSNSFVNVAWTIEVAVKLLLEKSRLSFFDVCDPSLDASDFAIEVS